MEPGHSAPVTLLGSVWLAPGAVVLSRGILHPLPQETAEVETAGEEGCYGVSREEARGRPVSPARQTRLPLPAPPGLQRTCLCFPRAQLHPGPGRQARCGGLSPQRQCQAPGPHRDSSPLRWAARRGGHAACSASEQSEHRRSHFRRGSVRCCREPISEVRKRVCVESEN